MQILLEIPDSDIPKKQEIITVPIHFIDGTICEAGGFGFDILPKEHGDLIDRDELLDWSYEIDSMYCEYDKVVNVTDIKDAPTIIEAERKSEHKRCKDECKKEAEEEGLVMSDEKCKPCEYLYVCPYMMAEMNDIVEGN